MRGELGGDYTDLLRRAYSGRVPGGADLVAFFFEKARASLAAGSAGRVGLLATKSIRKGANQTVLRRIKETGDIFMAWENEPWVLDGASLRISIVGFDGGHERERTLNGIPVETINADLTARLDITVAQRLMENMGLAFVGDQKSGPFELANDVASVMLAAPVNPNGRPNSDVVRPWINGSDLTDRPRGLYIINFGVGMPLGDAALFELPFEYVKRTVKPVRDGSRTAAATWWIHERPRPDLRRAIAGKPRFISTPRVSKHRVFVWTDAATVPDSRLFVFARDDDYFFGVLHSRVHEVWSLAQAPQHGVGNDPTYNAMVCYETFPLPWPPGFEPVDDPRVVAIAEAAAGLDRLRSAWLNPEGATESELKKRTLTNLYNARPTWLTIAHQALDAAVWSAYGWDDDPAETTDEEILTRLLALNREPRSRVESESIARTSAAAS